jgi:hypothetical protein
MCKKGFEVCECGKFAFIYSDKILRTLPSDYVGELCPQCNMWVCDIRHLTQRAGDKEESNDLPLTS